MWLAIGEQRDRKVRAQGIELLSHVLGERALGGKVLEGKIRAAVLALAEGASDKERMERAANALGFSPIHPSYEGRLHTMLGDTSVAVRAIAAAHAGELNLVSLKADLEKIQEEQHGPVVQVVSRALERFSLETSSPVSA